MAFCGKCGTQVDDGVKFCPGCGAEIEAAQSTGKQTDYAEKLQAMNDTADTTAEFDNTDIQQNKVMAVLAYFGPLVLIPIFGAKTSPFAKYHSNQGLILLIAEIVYGIALSIASAIILAISYRLYFLVVILGAVRLVFLLLAILGIINAANGQAKELPVIGAFKLLK